MKIWGIIEGEGRSRKFYNRIMFMTRCMICCRSIIKRVAFASACTLVHTFWWKSFLLLFLSSIPINLYGFIMTYVDLLTYSRVVVSNNLFTVCWPGSETFDNTYDNKYIYMYMYTPPFSRSPRNGTYIPPWWTYTDTFKALQNPWVGH